jgi:hypothetical protein
MRHQGDTVVIDSITPENQDNYNCDDFTSQVCENICDTHTDFYSGQPALPSSTFCMGDCEEEWSNIPQYFESYWGFYNCPNCSLRVFYQIRFCDNYLECQIQKIELDDCCGPNDVADDLYIQRAVKICLGHLADTYGDGFYRIRLQWCWMRYLEDGSLIIPCTNNGCCYGDFDIMLHQGGGYEAGNLDYQYPIGKSCKTPICNRRCYNTLFFINGVLPLKISFDNEKAEEKDLPNIVSEDDISCFITPNPTEGNAVLHINSKIKAVLTIKFYDINGNLITKYTDNKEHIEFKKTIDCGNWHPGVYTYTIEADNKILCRNKYILIR